MFSSIDIKNIFKEIVLWIVVLSLIAILTCACQSSETNKTSGAMDSVNTASTALPEEPAVSKSPTNTPPPTADPQQGIQTLLTMGLNRVSSFTEDGFYFVSGEKDLPGAQNLKYIDYATRKEIFLCTSPSCTHDTDACTSYIPSNYGIGFVFAAYDHLFVIGMDENNRGTIQMRDLDGSNAVTLMTVSDGEQLDLAYFAADAEHFYYIRDVGTISDSGVMAFKRVLESVDLQTKEIKQIYHLTSHDFCVGSCGTAFLMRDVDPDTEKMTEYALDLNGQKVANLYLPDVWGFDEQFLYYTNEGIIYQVIFSPNCKIYALNILTGEKRLIVENYPADSYGFSWFGAPVNGYMPTAQVTPIDGGPQEETHCYLLNLATGEYLPSDMTYSDNRVHMISPIAPVGDSILVITGQEKMSRISHTPVYRYALISIEDYYHSRPNYIEIEKVDG